jgi:hypothetical protein
MHVRSGQAVAELQPRRDRRQEEHHEQDRQRVKLLHYNIKHLYMFSPYKYYLFQLLRYDPKQTRPWMAMLEVGASQGQCGGSLVNHLYVLTAAHCFCYDNDEDLELCK